MQKVAGSRQQFAAKRLPTTRLLQNETPAGRCPPARGGPRAVAMPGEHRSRPAAGTGPAAHRVRRRGRCPGLPRPVGLARQIRFTEITFAAGTLMSPILSMGPSSANSSPVTVPRVSVGTATVGFPFASSRAIVTV